MRLVAKFTRALFIAIPFALLVPVAREQHFRPFSELLPGSPFAKAGTGCR
jgi:hypothetical protein